MRKYLMGMLAAAASVAILPASAKACGEVSITEMNWASAQVVTAVSKFLMEQGYGCKVTVVPSATVTGAASLVENGKPDLVTELWLNGAPAVVKLIKSGKALDLGKVLSDGGIEGWYLPKFVVDKHPELAKIEGLPAIVFESRAALYTNHNRIVFAGQQAGAVAIRSITVGFI